MSSARDDETTPREVTYEQYGGLDSSTMEPRNERVDTRLGKT